MKMRSQSSNEQCEKKKKKIRKQKNCFIFVWFFVPFRSHICGRGRFFLSFSFILSFVLLFLFFFFLFLEYEAIEYVELNAYCSCVYGFRFRMNYLESLEALKHTLGAIVPLWL